MRLFAVLALRVKALIRLRLIKALTKALRVRPPAP
jgi:hypothetical protein